MGGKKTIFADTKVNEFIKTNCAEDDKTLKKMLDDIKKIRVLSAEEFKIDWKSVSPKLPLHCTWDCPHLLQITNLKERLKPLQALEQKFEECVRTFRIHREK